MIPVMSTERAIHVLGLSNIASIGSAAPHENEAADDNAA